MAYQNVGTPRFYVNVLEWLESVGATGFLPEETPSHHFKTLPVLMEDMPALIAAYPIPLGSFTNKSFVAILGHTLGTSGDFFQVVNGGLDVPWNGVEEVVNSSGGDASYDGFSINLFSNAESIITADGAIALYVVDQSVANIGSAILGTYYDMPNAPNLSLTMSREYGGTKEFTTYNGGTMSNTMWSKPPKWGTAGEWELYESLGLVDTNMVRSGRRTWDLSFSYLQDSDVFGVTGSLLNYDASYLYYPVYNTEGYEADDTSGGQGSHFNSNLLTDDNFYSQVWHKTLGGTLPFIFQPDSNNNNPDQFAICRFKDNSLKATQSAFNVYDISLSIDEVW